MSFSAREQAGGATKSTMTKPILTEWQIWQIVVGIDAVLCQVRMRQSRCSV